GGVNRVSGDATNDVNWTSFTPASAPPCPEIGDATAIAEDAANGRVRVALAGDTYDIDAGPGDGACMYEIASNTWHYFHTVSSGLADNTVLDLVVDSEGRAWFATSPYQSEGPGGVYLCSWVDNQCYWEDYLIAD